MSVASFVRKILGSSAAQSVETFALSETAKAVQALIALPTIGPVVAADIASVTDSRLSNAQKFEQVVANTAPLILTVLTKAGRAATLSDVDSLTRATVQQVFNDAASTKAGTVAAMLLGILGIK